MLMLSFFLFLLVLTLPLNAAVAAVCKPSQDVQQWPFSASPGSSYSCVSSAGGTNDMGNVPTMCENDPASVFIQVTVRVHSRSYDV